FRAIHWHYDLVAAQLSLKNFKPQPKRQSTVIVPTGGVHRAVVQALDYARSISEDVRAVYVDVDPRATRELRGDWETWGEGGKLVTLESPYRSLMEPLLEYLEEVEKEQPNDFITMLLPEF